MIWHPVFGYGGYSARAVDGRLHVEACTLYHRYDSELLFDEIRRPRWFAEPA